VEGKTMAYEHHIKKVDGRQKADIFLFTLSTCGWCRKTKNLLNELGLAYSYLDMDQLNGEAQKEAVHFLDHWNQDHSYPTVVIDKKESFVGFNEESLRKLAGSDAK
jgi:glutaredoxin-like protein NrdH